jgi:hypothetical protein
MLHVPIGRRAPWHARRDRSIKRANFASAKPKLSKRRGTCLGVSNGMVLEAPELFVEKVMRRVGSRPEVFD